MAKILHVDIKSCPDCPYYEKEFYDRGDVERCNKTNVVTNDFAIPPWCPLPDANTSTDKD